MKIAVIGAGAMGSIYGGHLADSGEDVILIDIYKEHVDAINRNGLSIELPEGKTKIIKNIKALTSPKNAGIMDLIIIFVKSTVTKEAAEEARKMVGDNTLLLTLQNGLGNAETIAEVVGEEKVLLGITTYGGTFLGPGKVRLAGRGETLIGGLKIGEDRIKPFVDTFNKAGLSAHYRKDAEGLVWDKLFVNIVINPITAITGIKNGEILNHEEALKLAKELACEAVNVAKKKGIDRDPEEVYKHALDIADKTAKNISSMLQDVTKKRKTEIDTINGKIVEYGEKLNIPTPYNETITSLVKIIENTYLKG